MKALLAGVFGIILAAAAIAGADRLLPWFEAKSLHGENELHYSSQAYTDRKYIRETGETIYDVKYHKVSDFERLTPSTQRSPSRYAVFLGCSFVFGTGGNDDQTLPYYFEKNAEGFHSYNFGQPGFGPNKFLLTAQQNDIRHRVSENSGYVIYTFIDYHLVRTLARWSFIGQGADDQPYFKQTSQGSLKYLGNFAEVFPLQSTLAKIFASSNIVQHFGMEWPPQFSPKDLRYFVNVVSELRSEYRKKLPKAKFLVLIFPGSQYAARLIPELESAGLHYLDYSNMTVPEYPYDGHPTPAAHEFIAKHLADQLAH